MKNQLLKSALLFVNKLTVVPFLAIALVSSAGAQLPEPLLYFPLDEASGATVAVDS
ncbi:MAG: hypothetical protein ACJAT6_001958, partial [Akkermansiaceae bacterium]